MGGSTSTSTVERKAKVEMALPFPVRHLRFATQGISAYEDCHVVVYGFAVIGLLAMTVLELARGVGFFG